MKKVINQKLYDTETATKVGEWSNGYGQGDFRWAREELYMKRTGEYFLYGEGGGLSQYAGHYGDSSGDGEAIEPLTYNQARDWAEAKLGADDYMRLFEIQPEEEYQGTVQVQAVVSAEARQRLDIYRKKRGETLSEALNSILLALE